MADVAFLPVVIIAEGRDGLDVGGRQMINCKFHNQAATTSAKMNHVLSSFLHPAHPAHPTCLPWLTSWPLLTHPSDLLTHLLLSTFRGERQRGEGSILTEDDYLSSVDSHSVHTLNKIFRKIFYNRYDGYQIWNVRHLINVRVHTLVR